MIFKKLKFISFFLLITGVMSFSLCDQNHSKNRAISMEDFLKDVEKK
jgi:hypothetical protein